MLENEEIRSKMDLLMKILQVYRQICLLQVSLTYLLYTEAWECNSSQDIDDA